MLAQMQLQGPPMQGPPMGPGGRGQPPPFRGGRGRVPRGGPGGPGGRGFGPGRGGRGAPQVCSWCISACLYSGSTWHASVWRLHMDLWPSPNMPALPDTDAIFSSMLWSQAVPDVVDGQASDRSMLQGGPPPAQGAATATLQAPPTSAAPAAPPAPQTASASAVVPGQEGGQLTTAMLAAASSEQQKSMLGERLYPLVHGVQVSSMLPPCHLPLVRLLVWYIYAHLCRAC